MPISTFIYDRTGEHLLYRLEGQRRDLVTRDQAPKRLREATIAIEDKSYWTNPGVDLGGIIRAWRANQASGALTQGGSTITRQLIKTRLLGDEPAYARKIKEAILALEATRIYPGGKILEMHFNRIHYGDQAYGVKAAAGTHFGVGSLDQLALGQMALLRDPRVRRQLRLLRHLAEGARRLRLRRDRDAAARGGRLRAAVPPEARAAGERLLRPERSAHVPPGAARIAQPARALRGPGGRGRRDHGDRLALRDPP